ncbi:MAG: hypothetical protein WKF78_04280 [Candidatus Limnocylindrales bacterium]
MTPFNGTARRDEGRRAVLPGATGCTRCCANNSIHTNPPLCITEDELADGFEIIDAALDIADQAVDAGSRWRRAPAIRGRRGRRRDRSVLVGIGLAVLAGVGNGQVAGRGAAGDLPMRWGSGVDVFHDPPFRWPFATDLNLPTLVPDRRSPCGAGPAQPGARRSVSSWSVPPSTPGGRPPSGSSSGRRSA